MLTIFFNDFHFLTRYYAAGEFDTYPPEVKGGSILILRGETKTPSEFADFIRKRQKMTPEQIKKVSYKFLNTSAHMNKDGCMNYA